MMMKRILFLLAFDHVAAFPSSPFQASLWPVPVLPHFHTERGERERESDTAKEVREREKWVVSNSQTAVS